MSPVTIVLLVILAVLIAASIALYFLGKKSQKRKRNLRKSTVVDSTNVKSMKKALPYL